MYTIVTGAAGFIGANLVKALNARGVRRIIAVDNLTRADKFRNLVDCEIADYLDKQEFLDRLLAGHFDGDVDAILHQGACSDTMESDGRYMMENNYRYSLGILDWCLDQEVPLLYASSAATYGGGRVFCEERVHEAPLNVYGYSKFLFDQIVRQRSTVNGSSSSQVVGFRYLGRRSTARRARRWSVSVILTSMDRASRTRGEWLRWLFTITTSFAARAGSSSSPVVTAMPTASSDATSCSSATSSGSICSFSITRRSRGFSTSARAARRPSTSSRWPTSMPAGRLPARKRCHWPNWSGVD